MKKALYLIASAFTAFILLLVYLAFSHSGNVILWNQATSHIEGLSGELVEGKLLTGWTLKNPALENQFLIFTADTLKVEWQLSALLSKRLPVELVEVRHSSFVLKRESSKSASNQNSEPTEVKLPTIQLPFAISLKQLFLTDASYQQGTFSETVDSLSLSFDAENSQFKNIQLKADHALASATLAGNITLSDNYPLTANIDATIHKSLLKGELENQNLTLHTYLHYIT